MTSLWSFTMEDQCLDEDETLLADEWESPSEELNFLCNNPGEEGKSIFIHLIEFPFLFNLKTTPYYALKVQPKAECIYSFLIRMQRSTLTDCLS